METILAVDVNNLMARNFFGIPFMEHKGERTEAIFGTFRDLLKLVEEYRPDALALCFDYGKPRRLELLPTYKSSRKDVKAFTAKVSPHRAWKFLEGQVHRMRQDLLPACGLRNVLWENGYEADDIIAGVARWVRKRDKVVIVSTDKDLYQCLRPSVMIHNHSTGKVLTDFAFQDHWQIGPRQWAKVKAMAGCATDDIPGIAGVGEITAAKYLRGDLTRGSVAYNKIVDNEALWRKNLHLTTLPFRGTPDCDVTPDRIKLHLWKKAMESVGITSLLR